MTSGILLALAIALPGAPDSLVVRGLALENRYATVGIPALRIGARIANDGSFTLRLPRGAGCQELILRSMRLEVVVRVQFAKSDTLIDVGALTLPERKSYSTFGVDPLLSDTLGTCKPDHEGPWPDRWLAAEGTLRGVVTRDGRPLRKAPMEVTCGYVGGSGPGETDSTGAFALTVKSWFPDVLDLVNGSAACQLRTAVEFDSPLDVIIPLARPDRPTPVTEVDWNLPRPSFTIGDTIASPGDRNAMRHFQDAVGFSALVTPAAQLVRMGVVERSPRAPTVYRQAACRVASGPRPAAGNRGCIMTLGGRDSTAAAQFLPWALLVSTGKGDPSWGRVLVNLPAEYVKRIEAGEKVSAYFRVPPMHTADPDAWLPVKSAWMPALKLLSIDLLAYHFDDQRSPRHEFEALLVVRVGTE